MREIAEAGEGKTDEGSEEDADGRKRGQGRQWVGGG